MAINFPSNPSNNQTYTYGTQTWYWANNLGVWNLDTTDTGVNTDYQYTFTNNITFQTTTTFGNSTVNSTANSTVFTGTSYLANNASYLGGVAAAGYQTTAGLSGNVATLTSNNSTYAFGKSEANLNVNSALTSNSTSFVGSVSAANVVSNSQLSSNLANYQTSAGLSANVATLTSNNSTYAFGKSEVNLNVNSALTANNSTYAFGKSEVNLNVNSALTANNSNYLGGVAAASYINTSGSYTITGVHTYGANIVLQTSAGISANSSYGTAGQVLTTNGTSVYWSTVTGGGGGGGGVNTDAQYTFTNNITFQANTSVANLSISGVITANSSSGTAGQVLTSSSTGVYWSTISGGGGGGVVYDERHYNFPGNLRVQAGTTRWYIQSNTTLQRIRAVLNSAPLGSNAVINVLKNNAVLQTITIPQNQVLVSINTSNTNFQLGDYITVDITQIGTNAPGTELVVSFFYNYT